MTRQIILDTETTGIDFKTGHRIIEIGCVEMFDRRLTGETLHFYLNPDRIVEEGAIKVHGISNEFLQDKPRFYDVVSDFMAFITDAELIIHNAEFDIGFLNTELALLRRNTYGKIEDHCQVFDTLALARKMYPGQRNSLDALSKRHQINTSHRTLHGALLDAEILAQVYLALTGGQKKLFLEDKDAAAEQQQKAAITVTPRDYRLRLIKANSAEVEAHETYLKKLALKA